MDRSEMASTFRRIQYEVETRNPCGRGNQRDRLGTSTALTGSSFTGEAFRVPDSVFSHGSAGAGSELGGDVVMVLCLVTKNERDIRVGMLFRRRRSSHVVGSFFSPSTLPVPPTSICSSPA
jgi:hypothetical protein